LPAKSDKVNYGIDYIIPDSVSAPVKKGDTIGSITVIIDNKIVKEISVLAACDIAKNTYGDCIGDIINNW
jgi:hypothetical protein